jgi:hypothetical protein
LDNLEVERRRGITVKAQTASMFYNYDKSDVDQGKEEEEFLLNLIDTPVKLFSIFFKPKILLLFHCVSYNINKKGSH